MKTLAIDYGTKRVGLALYTTSVGVVVPFGVVEAYGEELIKKLQPIIATENIGRIVLGLPLSLDGSENGRTKTIRDLGAQLTAATGVAIEFFDERFTSRAADQLTGSGVSRDEKAAMVILEGWITRMSNS